MKPRILLINDDGIRAPGLKHLWKSLVDFVDLTIIAPSAQKSGVGVSLTLRKPLHIDEIPWERGTPAWQVSGTPADCVRLALSVILDFVPDLIVSGINQGSNSGKNVFYSGTVGGVIEGVLRDVPGVAFSCEDFKAPNYAVVEKHIYPIVDHLLKNPLPPHTLLNINFPLNDEIKGYKLARQGRGFWMEDPDKRIHPEGQTYYWLGGKWKDHDESEDSDVALLKQGYMTAVPIHVDELTHHAVLKDRKESFETLFNP
jgi:5'-nucleotidase